MKDAGEVVLTILLAMMGALGLLMSLCGGAVSLMSLGSAHGMLMISLPSLAIGVLLLTFAVRKIRRDAVRRRTERGNAPEQS